MQDEDLSLLARLARALFPEVDHDPVEQQLFPHPSFASNLWRQHEGVWLNQRPGGWRAGRHAVHVPGLHATPHILARAHAGHPPADRTTRDLLADPRVGAALPVDGFTMLREDMVVCRHASPAEVIALVRAIDAARRAPWQAVADRLGLPLDARALSIVGRTGGLLGKGERFDVRIHEERRHTRIRIALHTPLAEGVSIRAGKPEPGEELHHPILDRAIAARGVDRALRRKLLSVEEALLDLLAAFPDSDIDSRRIRVVAPGRLLADLGPVVEHALEVVRALA